MYSFDERFQELWSLIPTIVTYEDYCGLANEIDNAFTGREITYRDEIVLLQHFFQLCWNQDGSALPLAADRNLTAPHLLHGEIRKLRNTDSCSADCFYYQVKLLVFS